jgi:hypothetical protein
MTPKERITLAFQNKKPDRIPIPPELWDVIPIKVSGRSMALLLLENFRYGKLSLMPISFLNVKHGFLLNRACLKNRKKLCL